MTVLAVAGLPGAPGATSLALALAARIPGAVLVEADPDGGVLAVRLDRPVGPGLAGLVSVARNGLDVAGLGQVATDTGGVRVVVAEPAASTVTAVLGAGAARLATALAAVPIPVVVDLGRLRPDGPGAPLLACAARVVVVARPDIERAAWLQALPPAPQWGLVTVGRGTHPPAEVAAVAGWRLLASLPDLRRRVPHLRPGSAGRDPLAALAHTLTADLQPHEAASLR